MSFDFVFRIRLEDVFKIYWSRRIYMPWSYIYRIRLQEVFKRSWSRRIYSPQSYVFESRRLQDILQRRLQGGLKASWRRLQDVFKMSSRCTPEDKLVLLTCLLDVFKTSSRCHKDVCKTYNSRKIDLVNMSTTSFQDVLQRRLSTERFTLVTLPEKFMTILF